MPPTATLDPDLTLYAMPADALGTEPAISSPDVGAAFDPGATGGLLPSTPAAPVLAPAIAAYLASQTGPLTPGGPSPAPMPPANTIFAGATDQSADQSAPQVDPAYAARMAMLQQVVGGNPSTYSPPNMPGPAGGPPQPAPAPAPGPPVVPKLDPANKWIGLLAALATLGGAHTAGTSAADAMQANRENQLQTYDAKEQAYRANQQQQAQQTAQQQDTQDRTIGAQSELMTRLEGMDPATQEQYIRAMDPSTAAAFGFTPETLQQTFFGADGKFVPVQAAVKPTNPVEMEKARTAAFKQFTDLSPEAQQHYHDTTDPETFQEQLGIPWDDFQPMQTEKDTEATANDVYSNALKQAQIDFTKARASGVPQQIAIAKQRLVQAQQLADQRNATEIRGQNLTHEAAEQRIGISDEGLKLRQEMEPAQLVLRQKIFSVNYGPEGVKGAAEQYNNILKQRATIDKRLTELEQPTVSPSDSSGERTGPPLMNGPGAAEYNRLMLMDKSLNEQQYALLHPAAARQIPAPIVPTATGYAAATNGFGQPQPGVSVPAAPPLPGMANPRFQALHKTLGNARSAAGHGFDPTKPIDPRDLNSLPTGDLIQRLAWKYRGLR